MSDETRVRLGPGVYRVSTIQDPLADSAYNIYTQSTTSDATLYLTLVNSNNTPASKETVYTNYGLTYNPLIRNLSIGSSIQISPDRLIYTPTSFYIGNGSTVGITSFSGNIRLGGNSILSSSGDTVVSFADTNTEFKGNVTVLGNFNTNNIIAGIVTATRFIGDGSQLTGIVAGSSYAASAGIATYATTAGISTVAQGLTGTPNLIVGIVTATRFIGDGSQLTGINGETGIATYAASAGIATIAGYASSAGIATYASSAGIATIAGYASSAGIATYATYASSAGIATYASSAGIATYASSAGIATIAGYASSAGIATYAASAGIATIAGYASSAGIATYAQGLIGTPNLIVGIVTATRFIGDGSQLTGIVAGSSYAASAGISTVAQGLTGTPNLIVGIVTATRFIGDGSQLTGIVAGSSYAASAGIATYANVSGIASYASSAGIATFAGYASSAGIATFAGYASSAGIATFAGYASSAGIATYANVSGIASYASSAGIATYANVSGIATQITSAITGSGLTLATNRLVGRSTAATGAPEEIALGGALSFVSTTLAFSDVIKLVVSNKGETATVATNYVETTVQRACTVIGAFWELAPSATGSSSSQAMLYARRSGTKTSLLSANASLASSAILTDATSLLTGSQALAAGDTVGVDLVAIGTGSSGHIFTVIVRYS
jgi:hypothetical protein